MKVFLFDIDGTLINSAGAGGAALMGAFQDQFAVESPERVPFSGRTDRAIVRSLFEAHGIPDSIDNFQRLALSYLERLPDSLRDRQGRILDGVAHLLDRLHAAPRTAVGLLTGNLRAGAEIKLDHYGLFERFDFGGFGDVHYDRDDVARDALEAARPFLAEDATEVTTWVIGDTPLDIRCARAIDAKVVAVATGVHPKEELEAAEPDLLLDDLSPTDQLLEAFDS